MADLTLGYVAHVVRQLNKRAPGQGWWTVETDGWTTLDTDDQFCMRVKLCGRVVWDSAIDERMIIGIGVDDQDAREPLADFLKRMAVDFAESLIRAHSPGGF